MKLYFILIIIFFLNNCSFDNKTGIWEEDNPLKKNKDYEIFKDFKKISSSKEIFEETIIFKKNFNFNLSKPISNNQWNDIFFDQSNNFKNFKYLDKKQLIFKSKKITKYLISNYLLYEDENLIINDTKGNIIVYDINENKIISKFNFYKQKFKKIEKKINFIVKKNIIYVADNLGYIYAFNYKSNKIIWAKNFNISFSSNIKLLNDKIFISSQQNDLYILNINDGNILKLIPTEDIQIKSEFVNNLSSDDRDQVFFLNSFGSLYSININNLDINWFNNFNKSTQLTSSSIFNGKEIVNDNKNLIVSANNETFIIDIKTGLIKKKFNFSSKIKPIISGSAFFFLTKNNFLIAVNKKNNNILYSYNISIVEEIKKIIKKESIKDMMILNNKIFIYFNSKILIFNIDGIFQEMIKLSSKIKSQPIIVQNNILYLNKNNNLIIIN